MGYSRGTHAHHFGGGSILNQAVFWTKAKGSNGALVDGKGALIQHGSTSGADTNDPQWLPYVGTQYLYSPGVTGNSASTPDSAANSVTGDLDLQIWCALDDWTPSAATTLMSKFSAGAGQRSFLWRVSTGGLITLAISNDGSASTSANSSTALVVVDGADKWVRVTWRASDGRVQFFSGSDGSVWTQLGTDQTISLASIFDSTSVLEIGSDSAGTGGNLTGKIYRAKMYSGFSGAGGTLVFDADFTDPVALAEPFTTFTEKSSNAATVTINRSSTGRKATMVARDQYLLGTDDYFETAESASLILSASTSFTACILFRVYGPANGTELFAKKSSNNTGNAGWNLVFTSSSRVIGTFSDGTNAPFGVPGSNAFTVGQIALGWMTRDTGAVTVNAGCDANAGTPAADTTTSAPNSAGEVFRIGRLSGGGTSYGEFSFFGAAIFRRALTTTELAQVRTALLA